jgi:ElaB/YqjD/DUF883 family membrane-anchored ribosome-binding protein
MKRHKADMSAELENLADDAQALLSATANVAEEKVVEARRRLTGALEKGQEALKMVQDKAVESVKATDSAIRTHPYQAIGVALGVGALVGFLIARRN